jgi:uncharacterized protein (DUF2249 family)
MHALANVTIVDVRAVGPSERRATTLSAYRELAVGGAMQLLDDRNPIDLFTALNALAPGDFSWLYQRHGPAAWTITVQKLGRIYSAGECCGVCGGGIPSSTNNSRSTL